MRTVALGGLLVLFCITTSGRAVQLQPLQPALPGGALVKQANPIPAYKAPIATGPVVELLDENIEPLFPRLTNDGGGEAGTISREDRDVFAGVEAARVTPMQKYSTRLLGWNFRIIEKPAKAREFRYLRFAWKKIGGTGIMIQLHDPTKSWDTRVHAGQNVFGWQPAKSVAEKIPEDWEVVTVDLFKEFGARTVTGIAFSPLDGTAGLFDHVIMGRSIEDLDKKTDEVLGRQKLGKPLGDQERDRLWLEMTGNDSARAATALRTLLATAPDHVAYIRGKLAEVPLKSDEARVRKLIESLDAESFDEREAAMDELVKMGAGVVEAVRRAGLGAGNDEVRYRCRVILKKLGSELVSGGAGAAARLSRAIRVLERAGSKEARELLTEIADRKIAGDLAPDARAALARMPK
jgi:hypothetical protein